MIAFHQHTSLQLPAAPSCWHLLIHLQAVAADVLGTPFSVVVDDCVCPLILVQVALVLENASRSYPAAVFVLA